MKKDFKKWHSKRSEINGIEKYPFFHEREIWFCHLGENVGFEQDGIGDDFQRPVVIVRKFNNEICWTVPLSKTEKRGIYYFAFPFDETTVSVAILSQIKLIDTKEIKSSDRKIIRKELLHSYRKTQGAVSLSFSIFPLSFDRVGPKSFVAISIANPSIVSTPTPIKLSPVLCSTFMF